MDENKNNAPMEVVSDGISDTFDVKTAAEIAAKQEAAAKRMKRLGSYTHKFKVPFTYSGYTFEQLTFDWISLTGEDSLAIERELNWQGINLVEAAYCGPYLVRMAARACTERDAGGNRIINRQMLSALPLADFHSICSRARNFLLNVGS